MGRQSADSMLPACELWRDSLDHLGAFWRDLIDIKMFPIKLLFFMELAAIVAIWPHISTHMAHLRLTPDETGLIIMLGSVAGIAAALSAGYIGDKMGNFKGYLGLALLLEGISGTVLAFLPPAVVDVVPLGPASLHHSCIDGALHVSWQHEECTPLAGMSSLNATLRDCVLVCAVEGQLDEPMLGGLVCKPEEYRCTVLFPAPGSPSPSPLPILLANSTNTSSPVFIHPPSSRSPIAVSCPSRSVADCRLRCADTLLRAEVCAPTEDRSRHSFTLGLYIALRVVYAFCLGTTFTLIDSAVLSYCAKYGVDYGFQRLWGTLAALAVSPLSGMFMDWLSVPGETNFRPGFYLQGGFRLLSLVVLIFVNISFRNNPPEALMKHTWRLMRNLELCVLFFVLLLTGMVVGHIETFTYVYLSSLGADRTLIGFTITVGSGVEVVMLAISGLCLRAFGHVALISLGILLYGVRLVGYWAIQDPVYSLLLETLDGINGGLMNTAAVTYAASMVPPEMVTTVRGILGCFLFGGGRALGAQLGGYVVGQLGHRLSFLVFAALAAVASGGYLLFHGALWYRRSRSFKLGASTASCQPPLVTVSPAHSSGSV